MDSFVSLPRSHAQEHKCAYVLHSPSALEQKDIVETEVNVREGWIKWGIRGSITALYYSEYLRIVDMVPFVAMADTYDGVYFLGI